MAGENEKKRQPVVVVMGHVDHGKTTLLDYIRKTNVASREAGGITQGIGAYEIEHNGKKITFIDTPGHEAFSKMRSRGAEVADLSILVIAGEESVKPQTKEVINVLKETKTPFIVAINKIDKPSANVDKVKNDLATLGVMLEGYGGNISWHGISAKTGEGVNELLDLVVLAADLEGLTYDENENPEGFILETRMNKNRGIEASLIVRKGVIRKGDDVATQTAKGKIKILEDFTGKQISEAPAGSPALILGLESLPQTGERIVAKDISGIVQKAGKSGNGSAGPEDENALRLVLKASDAGSLEALSEIIRHLDPEKPLKILGESVGEINENDVKLALNGGAAIIGFKTKTDKAAKTLAQARDVRIIVSEIIYELVQAVQEFFAHMGEPKTVGELEVLAVFNQQKLEKQVVGGKVASGIFKKSLFDIKRGDEVVGTGRVSNLQSQKKDTSQVNEGDEAGLMVNSSVAIAAGDRLIIRE